MPATAILFCNPNSGRFSARQVDLWLWDFSQNGLMVKVVYDPQELASLPPSHIIAAGGDGTLHTAINAAGLKHSFSVLPVGSGNDFAANFKRLSVSELAKKILSDNIVRCDVLRVNHVYAHNVCGTGFESFVAGKARKSLWPALKYILPIARYMFFFKPVHVSITAGDFCYEGGAFMVTIGNGYRSGGGFRMFPKASLQDGKMDLVLIKPHNLFQRLRYVLLVNFGRHLRLEPVVFLQVASCKIELGTFNSFQADGDLYQAENMDVEVVSNGLSVIM